VPDRSAFRVYPIERIDVYTQVRAQLEALIATMRPGDRLPAERLLVEQLQVSRVVLREALRALEGIGKIEIRRQSGSYVLHPNGTALASQLKAVAPMDEAFLNHLVDVRAAIETKVVAVVGRAGPSVLPEVGELLARCERELVSAETGSLDMRFEAALGRLCGNPLLAEVQRNVHDLWLDAWSTCGLAPGSRTELHREHVAIYEALVAGEVEQAQALMADHVDRIVQHK
jgi:GntR family transcriptional repressor for pyruvate dehydrogenase complex